MATTRATLSPLACLRQALVPAIRSTRGPQVLQPPPGHQQLGGVPARRGRQLRHGVAVDQQVSPRTALAIATALARH